MDIPDDLTNLNWVSGAPVPIISVSPPRGHGRSIKPFFESTKTPVTSLATTPKKNGISCSASLESKLKSSRSRSRSSLTTPRRVRRPDSNSVSKSGGDRPKCSYTCLIGMAMQASPFSDGCLPVHEIYRYIEKEFPYFKTAPDGWKNSVRHNLSLNTSFRKVNRTDGWQGKKGHYWELTPEKKNFVDEEIRQFLASEGRPLELFREIASSQRGGMSGEDVMMTSRSSEKPSGKLSEKKTKEKKKKAKRKLKFSEPTDKSSSKVSTKPPSPPPRPNTPSMVKEYSKEMQEQLLNSEVSVVPTLSPTQTALDTTHAPSMYIGIEPPSKDPSQVATELFGISENHQLEDQTLANINTTTMGYNPSMVPFIAPVPYYGMPYGYPPAFIPDCSAMTPPMISPTTALTPFGSPFVSPQYIQCVPFSPYMGIVPNGGHPMFLSPPTEAFLQTPVSIEVLDSSQEMEIGEVIELIEDNLGGTENDKLNECNTSSRDEHNNVQNRLSLSELGSIEELNNSKKEQNLISLEDLKQMFGDDYCNLIEEEIVSTLKFLNQQAKQQRHHTTSDLTDHHSAIEIGEPMAEEPTDQEKVEIEEITNEIRTVESYLDCGQEYSQSDYPDGYQHIYTVQAGAFISEPKTDSAYSSNHKNTSIPRLESLLYLNDKNIECIEGALRLQGEHQDEEEAIVSRSSSTETIDVES